MEDMSICRYMGISICRYVDISVDYGGYVDMSMCRHVGIAMCRYVDVSIYRYSDMWICGSVDL